ncbi:MAG: crotonase [Comamonadaceae bacterium]|jgi:2-(1,2-epoxy-1,2-dihydrophenyl)acetyl-CoA isomerase|uniref:Crotonase n=1 Tax=Hydrogenophaga borbori TaxID=2294117 RepID=A0A372EL16_9BURK|nr:MULTISPECIES: enoyl-CoA hydratase-related protein [Hydrogenophaga]NCT96443.1 crotonase [Comamonadaceae bacterium]RFP80009.1 crotonase [Hydrogenophaga borbori]WQB85018.1 enoyl-CoA hydratase-related protein [Hydrogenophaga sp. SNF1]
MNPAKLLVEVRDGVMALTLNRPEKRNAIDNDLARALLAAIALAERDDAVRVLLLRGAGPVFCAGRDLGAPPTQDDLRLVQAVAQALVSLPKPVVAAVQGWAVGAGLEWALDADVVIAAEGARFKLPEASLGVFVTGGLTATLPAAVGLARAKGLVLLGEPIGAAQAQAWGMVWQVVADDALDASARQVCARLAQLAPEVAGRFKKVLNELGLAHFQRAIEAENTAQRGLPC